MVVRPATGEILAMANRPDFDPNRPGEFPAANRRNRAVTDTAEPGSTFKAVTVAGAINERLVSLESRFDCENGIFYHGGRPLRDHHPYRRLSVKEIITKSSNIGSAKVAMMLGKSHLHHYIRRFGFGERTRVSLPGEVSGTVHPLKRWNKLSITRVPMGHEVATTPIQMVMMASAIAHAACRADYTVRCFRLPRLVDDLAKAHAMNNRSGFFRNLAKVDLIVLDDFGLTPMADSTQRDLLEILDDRYAKKSTLITSQLPIDQWHTYLGDPTLADAMLDRLVHNSHRLTLTGESMRKRAAAKITTPSIPSA